MRITPAPAVLAFVLAAQLALQAEESPTPAVRENDLAEWDVAALAAGDWAEFELAGPSAPPAAGNKRPSRRLACVGVEGDLVWVEITMKNAGKAWEGMVLCLGARKADGKVAKAFWGKPGGACEDIAVGPPATGPAVAPGTPRPTVTATGTVTKEKTKAGTLTYDCEKVEIETQLTSSCCDEKARVTTWISEKVPFRARIDEKIRVNGLDADTTWNGKPSVKGGVVRRQVSSAGSLDVMTLLRSGTDAKETLKRPEPKK